MKLIGIMPVRNEDWIIGLSLRVALQWCDEVCVLLHDCTDASVAVVTAVALESNKPVVAHAIGRCGHWDEMSDRDTLLALARQREASHVALIDADEVLTANLIPHIRRLVESTPRGCMLDLPLYNLRERNEYPGQLVYHSNGVWGRRWVAAAFELESAHHWAGDRFHHREPMGTNWKRSRPIAQSGGGVLHFWGASDRRLRAKHALYKITERIRWPYKTDREIDDYYNLAIIPREPWTFLPVPGDWTNAELMQYLDRDSEPWQIAECQRLIEKHGIKTFEKLELFGVVKKHSHQDL